MTKVTDSQCLVTANQVGDESWMMSLTPDSTLGRKESVEPGVRAPLLTCPWPLVVPSWPGLHLLKINVKGLGLISPEASSNIL